MDELLEGHGGRHPSGSVPPFPSAAAARWIGRDDIAALIPHRAPIAMLDRAWVSEPGRHGIGEVELGADHPAFTGHFPGRPILPGVLIIEACAQLVAVVCRFGAERPGVSGSPPVDFLASVERFKFLSPVAPGAVLALEARIGRRLAGLLHARVAASTDGRAVAEGVLHITTDGQGA